ncbi:protein C2-DOMAIN ABA-RELATED 4-like [Capsicum galapagoense]
MEYPSVDGQYKLILKLMDHDTFSADDYLGDATIYWKEFIELGLENGRVENLKFILKNLVWWAVLNVTVVKFNLASLSPLRKATQYEEVEYGGWKYEEVEYGEWKYEEVEYGGWKESDEYS